MGSWSRHDRDEALDQFLRLKHERGRAVAPRSLEAQLQPAILEE